MTEQLSFVERVRLEVINGAELYHDTYLTKQYLICSSGFKERNYYEIKALEINFMHLTGLKSSLKAPEFYEKAIIGNLTLNDFHAPFKEEKGNIRRKIKALAHIGQLLFGKELFAEENFQKGRVRCKLAAGDTLITLGFAKGKRYLVPQSLMFRDTLQEQKKVSIDFVLAKENDENQYTSLVYGEVFKLNKLPDEVIKLIAPKLLP